MFLEYQKRLMIKQKQIVETNLNYLFDIYCIKNDFFSFVFFHYFLYKIKQKQIVEMILIKTAF